MYYIGNFVKSVTGVYNQINSATLTGAIDIVVVKQQDGSYIGSPFHVRFGKLGVLSSREKVVEIAINDEEVDLQMKLGRAGEAFFVEKLWSRENIPYNLATSPIPSSNFLSEKYDFALANQENNYSCDTSQENIISVEEFDQNKPRDNPCRINRTYSEPISIINHRSPSHHQSNVKERSWLPNKDDQHLSPPRQIHNDRIKETQSDYPLSDMDSPISGSPPNDSAIPCVYSDTEASGVINFKTSPPPNRLQEQNDPDMTWEWGMLPEGTRPKRKITTKALRTEAGSTSKKSHKKNKQKQTKTAKKVPPSEGLLLDEVLGIEDKEVAELYFNRANSLEDLESAITPNIGRGESTPAAQTAQDSAQSAFPFNASPIKSFENEEPENKDDTLPIMDEGEPKEIVLSLCGGLMNRRVEPDKFKSYIVSYEDFCGNPGLLNDPKLVIKINESYYNWAVAGPYLVSFMVYEKTLLPESLKLLKQRHMPKKRRGWFTWRTPQDQGSSEEENNSDTILNNDTSLDKLTEADNEGDVDSNAGGGASDTNVLISDDEMSEYKKTLRLTSDQWKSLKLQPGKNKITFTVTTRYQGTAQCHARIFLWSYNDKIVISDIDGTITKSDVLGQILPAMGRDWSQTGVTGLFSKIQNNGYHFIYLSARAISQAQLTRDFLRNIKQGELTLPDGPVLLTPTSLLTAFKKEVIERKPEEFKISCMKDIQSLYDSKSNPFFAGFGNRVNDMYAYRAVGIPISRIFTINYKGEIKHEISTAFSTSYSELIEMVDQMFPPISSHKLIDPSQSDFTAFSYWRTPITQITDLSDNPDDFEFP